MLFWLSLIPFTTGWMGEHNFAKWPVVLYGVNLLMCGTAYYFLARGLVRHHGKQSAIGKAVGSERKEIASVVIYAAAIGLSFVDPWISYACYAVVAVMWLVPDRRIENQLTF